MDGAILLKFISRSWVISLASLEPEHSEHNHNRYRRAELQLDISSKEALVGGFDQAHYCSSAFSTRFDSKVEEAIQER